jgi:citronellol/citronellal dehydrogenase
MADAAYAILTMEAASTTGNFFIDEEVLKKVGVTDFGTYSVVPGSKQLLPDLFL